ncbi:MAG: hypothetical protein ACQEW8_09925 [Actinomycetota bacterium]
MTKNTRPRWGAMVSAAILISGALLSPGAAYASHDDVPPGIRFAENAELSESEILSRTESLNERYTRVGQRLTPSDAEFVTLYAQVPAGAPSAGDAPSITPMATYGPFTFNKTARAAGGTGTIKGSMRLTIGDFSANNSWRASITSTGSSAVKKIKNCFRVRAYGTVGQSGIGLVYSTNSCATKSGRSHVMSRNQNYSAFVVYATITSDAVFYTSRGSFQVSS